MRLAVIALLAAIVLGAGYYYQTHHTSVAHLQIGSAKISVEIADNAAEQYQGLSDMDNLCENCGMLFVYKQAKIINFVMRGMRFPLDMVFVRDGKISEIWKDIPSPKAGEDPQYIQSLGPADQVIEVNAGFSAKNNLKIGETASIDGSF